MLSPLCEQDESIHHMAVFKITCANLQEQSCVSLRTAAAAAARITLENQVVCHFA